MAENYPQSHGMNETARVIGRIWADVLGADEVSTDDNFFEIGGTSVQAMVMLNQIEQDLGISVPMSSLFELKTLSDLSRYVDYPRMCVPSRSQSASLMVKLRQGTDRERSIFLVHPYGGSAFSYMELAKRLDGSCSVYGLMAQGMEGVGQPLETVEQMAQLYASIIVSHLEHSGRPAAIGGWSFGSFVAFELAVRLAEIGVEPIRLLLFDPRPDLGTRGGGSTTLHDEVVQFWKIDVDRAQLSILNEDDKRSYVLEQGVKQRRLPRSMSTEALFVPAAVRRANARAFREYRTDSLYSGRTWVFVAGDERERRLTSTFWKHQLLGQPKFEMVSGRHSNLMRTPDVIELANLVDRAMSAPDYHRDHLEIHR